ncbi:MAG: alpha/beta fold hydrolase [Actinobacteria bacterium]|nr:alpha/beta fold hydrolase [Actinomycetota bacterium]
MRPGASDVTADDFRATQQRTVLSGIARLPLEVAYIDQGPADASEVIVLLHGIPTWSYLYGAVIPLLAGHARVIAPDFIGHGWSDRRDVSDRSLEAQARMVIALLDDLGMDRVHLVGHDTGGGVGLNLALDAPERLATLTLSNAVAYDSWPIDDMIALGDPQWARKDPAEIAEFVRGGLPDGISRPERLTDAWTEGIAAPYADPEGALSLVRNASALNTSHTSALTPLLGQITTPTLLLWGVDDPWQRLTDAERLQRDIPGAELIVVDNASHWIPQDAPEEFAEAILAFVGRHSS